MAMSMKKPMVIKKPGGGAGIPAPAASGGATIADRFKLEPASAAAPAKGGTVNKTAALIALLAAFAALVVSGALTFILYQHWQFLMPA